MTILSPINASASPEVQMNDHAETLSAAGIYGKRQTATSGLIWGYYGGLYNGATVADGTVTLTNATNYIVVLRSSGVVSVSTATTNGANALYARLYQVTAAGGVVTAVVDQRMDANGLLIGAAGAGGGSGALTASGFTMATARLLGRTTAATGAIEEITVGAGLTLSAGALTASAATRVGVAFEKELAMSDLTTALTTGTTKAYFRPAFAATGVSARASLRVASSSGIPTVDMNKTGATMMSTKLTIDASELTSVTAATAVVMSTTTWSADDLIEFDIDVAGTGAMGLIVTVTGLYA